MLSTSKFVVPFPNSIHIFYSTNIGYITNICFSISTILPYHQNISELKKRDHLYRFDSSLNVLCRTLGLSLPSSSILTENTLIIILIMMMSVMVMMIMTTKHNQGNIFHKKIKFLSIPFPIGKYLFTF